LINYTRKDNDSHYYDGYNYLNAIQLNDNIFVDDLEFRSARLKRRLDPLNAEQERRQRLIEQTEKDRYHQRLASGELRHLRLQDAISKDRAMVSALDHELDELNSARLSARSHRTNQLGISLDDNMILDRDINSLKSSVNRARDDSYLLQLQSQRRYENARVRQRSQSREREQQRNRRHTDLLPSTFTPRGTHYSIDLQHHRQLVDSHRELELERYRQSLISPRHRHHQQDTNHRSNYHRSSSSPQHQPPHHHYSRSEKSIRPLTRQQIAEQKHVERHGTSASAKPSRHIPTQPTRPSYGPYPDIEFQSDPFHLRVEPTRSSSLPRSRPSTALSRVRSSSPPAYGVEPNRARSIFKSSSLKPSLKKSSSVKFSLRDDSYVGTRSRPGDRSVFRTPPRRAADTNFTIA
jgi:hypothetical protein